MANPEESTVTTSETSLSIAPLCFVMMPFGKVKSPEGGEINFDAIYENAVKPSIEAVGLDPLRAEERVGGADDAATYESLLFSEFAIADLTTAHADVFYELGVRHATRRNTTLSIFAQGHLPRLPFHLRSASALAYVLGPNNVFGTAEAAKLREALKARLQALVERQRIGAETDSPLFEVLRGYQAPDIAHLKTDTFRQRVQYSEQAKQALETARANRDVEAIVEVEKRLGEFDESESGILVDILLSYRAFSQWEKMAGLVERMPATLQRTQMIQEQYGLALNRLKRRAEAIVVLEGVIARHGVNPETCGLLGRIYKDQWHEAYKQGDQQRAQEQLRRAIAMYLEGFEADWRDSYPGVNAVTLLDIEGSDESLVLRDELLPIVTYSVKQRFKEEKRYGTAQINYWDHATLLELAVLGNDEPEAARHLAEALAVAREDWELLTTANNLRMISTIHRERNAPTPFIDDIVARFEAQAKALAAKK